MIITGHIEDPSTYRGLMGNSAWTQAFAWLKEAWAKKPRFPEDNTYLISGNDIRAIVDTVATAPREACQFESHQREVDLHFCFTGSELIEFIPTYKLTPEAPYDPDRDVTLYLPHDRAEALHMRPGSFGIFYPQDAHMPKVRKYDDITRKVVIKLNREYV
jgi:YhcH/YjgK/YiaL family protein